MRRCTRLLTITMLAGIASMAGCSLESMDKFAKSTQDALDSIFGTTASNPAPSGPATPSKTDNGGKTQTADAPATPSIPSTPTTPTQAPTPPAPIASPATPEVPASIAGATVLAQGTVGPGGGRVEAPGKIRVDFPAGALVRAEKITIRASDRPISNAQFYFIDRDGGHDDLAATAMISITLPAGANPDKITPVEQLDEQFWSESAGTIDPATRQLSFKADHFSGKGWIMQESLLTHTAPQPRLFYYGGDFVLDVQVMSIDAGGNWGDATTNFGLARSLRTSDGIRIFWADISTSGNAIPSATTSFWATCDADGNVVDRGWRDHPPKTAPGEGRSVKSVARSVLVAAAEFGAVKNYYKTAGYPTPDEMLVTIHRGVKSGGGEKCAGEWRTVTKHMVLNADFVRYPSDTGSTNARQATIAHEYFHAIWQQAGYSTGRYLGLEDCFTTAYEAEVFPGNTDSYNLYPTELRKTIASGLCVAGENEHAERRGYRLWPWGRFVIRRSGHETVRKLITGQMPEADMQTLFKQFAAAMSATDRALPDTMPQDPATLHSTTPGTPLAVQTGWPLLSIGDMAMSTTISDPTLMPHYSQRVVEPGKHSFPWQKGTRPLSLSFIAIKVPGMDAADAESADAPSVIVRRQAFDGRELYLAFPPTSDLKALDRTPIADVGRGVGGVAIPRKKLENKDAKPLYALIGLIGAWTPGPSDTVAAGPDDPILVYRLLPPKNPSLKADSDTNMALKWERPDLGSTRDWILPWQVLSGYRLFGKDKQGKVTAIANLVFDSNAKGPSPVTVAVAPDKTELWLQKTVFAQYDPIGIASVDAVMKDASGQLLVSEIAWMAAEGIVDGTVGDPAPDTGNANSPFGDSGGYVPVKGAAVSLTFTLAPRNPVTMKTQTDDSGRFSFKGVPGDAEFTIACGKYTFAGKMPVPAKRLDCFVGAVSAGHAIKLDHVNVNSGK